MLPRVQYTVDKFHSGQFVVMKMVNDAPEGEEGRFWDIEEAKKVALQLSAKHIAESLFPYVEAKPEYEKQLDNLVDHTRDYFEKLLHLLPVANNGDAQQARLLVRQAFNFAKTAILMDGMV